MDFAKKWGAEPSPFYPLPPAVPPAPGRTVKRTSPISPRTRPHKPHSTSTSLYPGSIARPFLKWAGGKRRVLPLLLDKAPRSWNGFHEPFIGGGALFFALAAQKPRPAGWGHISDQNERLIRTYLSVRDHVEELIGLLKAHAEQHSKDYYYTVRARDIDRETDVEVAAWLIYLNRTGFNGLYRVNKKGGFNVPFGRYKNPTICDEPNLRACSAALQGVGIHCEGFDGVLDRAAKRDLVYFDPPYVPASKTSSFTAYTADGFNLNDQERLRDVARQLKQTGVQVMLSNADVPRVRKLYTPGFRKHAIEVKRAISANAKKRGAVGELIIR